MHAIARRAVDGSFARRRPVVVAAFDMCTTTMIMRGAVALLLIGFAVHTANAEAPVDVALEPPDGALLVYDAHVREFSCFNSYPSILSDVRLSLLDSAGARFL